VIHVLIKANLLPVIHVLIKANLLPVLHVLIKANLLLNHYKKHGNIDLEYVEKVNFIIDKEAQYPQKLVEYVKNSAKAEV